MKGTEPMKPTLQTLAMVATVAASIFFMMPERAVAQAGKPTAQQVDSPIGRLVAVQLVAWPLSTAVVGTVTGTLISMPAGWLVIKDGSFEHWVPVEKVMSMKVSR
jgi:hypothetical protein